MGQANSHQEAFWDACSFGRIHLVKKFIEEGIDVNWISLTHNCCPIHAACQGKPGVVKLLIEAGCDLNVKDIRGMTPLHHATMKAELNIIEMLIEAGSNLDEQDKNGWTPAHIAAYWCHVDVLRFLLHHGSAVHLLNKNQRLVLHEVARSPSRDELALGEVTRLLTAAGSHIDAISNDHGAADFTSLMYAAYHCHPEVAVALLDAGCNVNLSGSISKWTALHWASERCHRDIIDILVAAGADLTMRNMRGETAVDCCKNSELRNHLSSIMLNQNSDNSPTSPSQPSIARVVLDNAIALEEMNNHSKSRDALSFSVPEPMPPLAIETAEERKKCIRMATRISRSGDCQTPCCSATGCVPRVQLATDSLTGTNDKHWPELRRIREFHDRLNRRIDEARRTLQDNYLFPHCTDQ